MAGLSNVQVITTDEQPIVAYLYHHTSNSALYILLMHRLDVCRTAYQNSQPLPCPAALTVPMLAALIELPSSGSASGSSLSSPAAYCTPGSGMPARASLWPTVHGRQKRQLMNTEICFLQITCEFCEGEHKGARGGNVAASVTGSNRRPQSFITVSCLSKRYWTAHSMPNKQWVAI